MKKFYVTDPHGNVVQLTDESGKVVKTYEYDSFGNEVNPDKEDDNPFRYCGEYYDKETEEVYLRARYYQPGVGRFLTRDTYTGEDDDLESLHLYTYCGNDGVNAVDPSGHCYAITGAYKNDKGEIEMNRAWNANCGVKFHLKLKRNPKITDKYYLSAYENIAAITKITGFNKELKKFGDAFSRNRKRYDKIAKNAKVPAQLIAAIHYRENADDCLNSKFKIYLHNGQKLGQKTTIKPIGKLFYKNQFNQAAVDAIKDKEGIRKKYKLSKRSKDMAAMLAFAENYNGTGYADNHHGNSPYLYSGTAAYTKGKYTEDGYSSKLVDKQVGVFALINKILN